MEPYVGEIRIFAGSYAPTGWLLCDGKTLSISENEVLFAVLGTMYGGDGQTTFGLPDLRGRVPMHRSTSYPQGARGGTETVTLTQQNMASHTHSANVNSANGTSAVPTGHFWAGNAENTIYGQGTPNTLFAASAIGAAGGSQPHENMMPFNTLTFIIAVNGIYPSGT